MSHVILAASGWTCIQALGDSSDPGLFFLPVVGWSVAYNDFHNEVRALPLVPSGEGHLEVGDAPFQGLEWPGCEPSNWTQCALAHFKSRETSRGKCV